MIGIIFVILVLTTLWTSVLVLSLPMAIALVPTVAVVVGVGAVIGYRKYESRRAASEIEKSLRAQGESQAKTARPDQLAEIENLQGEFQKAVASLKTSKLAKGKGENALSVLPWYVIIGPPGAGKSTALRNSGLRFPYLSARGGGVRGVGGTRNCEWWLTNEAVILDTAGRYTTEDDDHEEWIAFIDMLVRTRPKRPINGLLVAVSLSDVIDLTPEASAELGHRLRERVDEVMGRLKMIVPVYVLFTKCDRISGFVEMFNDLGKGERGQVWGMTLSAARSGDAPGEVFAEKFDELTDRIAGLSLKRIGQARRIEDREKLFQFPAQLESLKPNLVELVQTLFVENVYQDTPVMRGIYFTSGTQEGAPVDRLMNAMSRAFGMDEVVPQEELQVEAKSYFLRDVFSKVIFPDQALAVRSASALGQEKLRRYGLAGGCLALAVFFLSLPTVSFFENRAMLSKTSHLVAEAKATPLPSGAAALARLAPLRAELQELVEANKQGPAWDMRLGMYQGQGVLEATSGLYAKEIQQAYLRDVLAQDGAELRAFIAQKAGTGGTLSAEEGAPYFDALKLHLVLTGPRDATEPPLDPALQAWAVRMLDRRWEERLGRTSDKFKELQAQLQLYMQILAADPSLAAPRDATLVRDARQLLKRMPPAALALQKLESGDFSDYDLNMATLVGAGLPELKSNVGVRGVFTRRAYDDKVKDLLDKGSGDDDAWVLATDPKAIEPDVLAAELRSYYFKAYIREWKAFLTGLQLQQPDGNAQELALLEDMTSGEPPPLVRLFRGVAFNTRLVRDGELKKLKDGLTAKAMNTIKSTLGGQGGAVVDAVAAPREALDSNGEPLLTARDLLRAFDGFAAFGAPANEAPAAGGNAPPQALPIDAYQEQLQYLRDAMRADVENPQDHGPLVAKLGTARIRVRALIDSQEVGWRPRLDALLWPPFESAARVTTQQMASDTSQKWCSAIYAPFKQNLAHRYPFDRNGQDAALADVADFFRPNTGTVWAFYNSDLKNDVLRAGERFEFAKRFGSAAGNIYSPQVLRFLTSAQDVSNSLFEHDTQDAAFDFSFHVQPMPKASSVTVSIDGQSFTYENGPEQWYTARWPGGGKDVGASIKLHSNSQGTDSLIREGEWGLFRMMEAATQVRATPGSPVFTLVWHFDRFGDLAIDFRPKRSATPVFGVDRRGKLQLMAPFRETALMPPAGVGRGAAGCSL